MADDAGRDRMDTHAHAPSARPTAGALAGLGLLCACIPIAGAGAACLPDEAALSPRAVEQFLAQARRGAALALAPGQASLNLVVYATDKRTLSAFGPLLQGAGAGVQTLIVRDLAKAYIVCAARDGAQAAAIRALVERAGNGRLTSDFKGLIEPATGGGPTVAGDATPPTRRPLRLTPDGDPNALPDPFAPPR